MYNSLVTEFNLPIAFENTKMSYSEMYAHVQDWLKSLYGEQGVPEFEISTQTVTSLYQLATRCEQNSRNAQLILEDQLQSINQYRTQSQYLSNLISSIGLPVSTENTSSSRNISRNSASSISGGATFDDPEKQRLLLLSKDLARLATTLNLSTANPSAMMHAISEMDSQQAEMEASQLLYESRKEELAKNFRETSELKNLLQRVSKTWQDQLEAAQTGITEKASNLKYLDSKAKEYSSTLQHLKETLKKTGSSPSIYHDTLRQLHDQLEEISTKAEEKQSQLEGFKQLPPDPSLAKLKIEEATQYLQSLEDQIARSVSNLQLHSNI